MTFDQSAAEQLAAEAAHAMQQVAMQFTKSLQDLVDQAAAEAARERQRLQEESTALAREKQRLEEAWQHLNVERARIEAGPVSSGHKPAMYPSPRESVGEATLTRSPCPVPQGPIPINYIVSVGDRAYTVLPLKEPEAMSLGHELWNHVVEVPEGWEVLSTQMENFHQVMSVLGQHRWGAMVLGVRNGKRGFDAYWTPLFGDGSFAAQLCEADVDWIEPAGPEVLNQQEQQQRRYRMTYSGLRLVIRKAHGPTMMTTVTRAPSGALSTPRMAGPMQVAFVPGAVYNGAQGYRSPAANCVTMLPQMFRSPSRQRNEER